MFRLLSLGLAGLLAASMVALAVDKPRPDKAILEDLKNTFQSYGKDRESIEDPKKLEEQVKKYAVAAQTLLAEFEKDHGKSSLLVEARSIALALLNESPDPAMIEKTQLLARKLKEVAAKGSDFAAQAELILIHADISKTLKEADTDDQLKKVWAKNADRFHKMVEDYIKTYPKYEPALEHLHELYGLSKTVGASKTHQLIADFAVKNFPKSPLGKDVRREQAVGKELEFDFTAVGNTKATGLKSLRGKVVVIDFWATWCGPCVKELPALKKLYEKHAKDGLEIVGVSLDEEQKTLTDYVKENKVPWVQVCGKTASDFADKWGIDAIPAMFVVDRKGKLRSIEARGKLEKLVPELLAEK